MPDRVSTDFNDGLLRKEIEALLPGVERFADCAVEAPGIGVLALGSLGLGREMAQGVLSETAAVPPRPLNAFRLARHLWELELELHYVSSGDHAIRLKQYAARDALNVLRVQRFGSRKRRAKLGESFKEELLRLEGAAKPKDDECRRRRCEGDEVAADEWGSLPDRRVMAADVSRLAEYAIYYGWASLHSHPSLWAINTVVAEDAEPVTIRNPSAVDPDLASMALSLTRTTLARLLLRAAPLLPGCAEGLVQEVEDYMREAGIPETGVVGSERTN